MLTSRRNWSSGSAVQDEAGAGPGADAPTAPAHIASSSAALRSHWPRPSMLEFLRSPPRLAQHRLRFGDHVGSVIVGFDILHGNRAGESALERRADRNGNMTRADLGVDGDRLLQRHR